MTSVPLVVETPAGRSADLRADEAWAVLRGVGRWKLVCDAFTRFRYADGFSHSRALGLQLSLSAVTFAIAFVGLSGALHTERLGSVLRETLLSLAPRGSHDVVLEAIEPMGRDQEQSLLALWLGLLVALVSLTVAMGQVERGANRIYGIRRDRPTVAKYARAFVMAGIAGLPSLLGFLVLVAGADFGEAVEDFYDVDDDLVTLVGWPMATVLLLGSITLMLRHSPRRRQPGWSWLIVGAGVSLVLWVVFTGLLATYLQVSQLFGAVYGPLTGVMALLLWAQLTSIAVFLGLAVTAQLEAIRTGQPAAADPDPERTDQPVPPRSTMSCKGR